MDRETQQILDMLAQGKISAAEAETLLEALEQTGAPPVREQRPRVLHITVSDTRSGRKQVDIKLPLAIVQLAGRMGLTLGVKQAPELADLNLDHIMEAMNSGARGPIVDIEDEEERQHVRVALE